MNIAEQLLLRRNTCFSWSLWTIFSPHLSKSRSSAWTPTTAQISLPLLNTHRSWCGLHVCPWKHLTLPLVVPLMGCNICSGCSSQTQRRFSYINITSYWLVLSFFSCSSFIFILCFLGLSTIISEHLICLPQGIHPQIFRNGVRFPDNLFSCLNKRHLLLEQMEMDGEHTLFVSSSRSCRWHPGTLDSAQLPLLMQPVWSSALLNPWISTASSEVARKFIDCLQGKQYFLGKTVMFWPPNPQTFMLS